MMQIFWIGVVTMGASMMGAIAVLFLLPLSLRWFGEELHK